MSIAQLRASVVEDLGVVGAPTSPELQSIVDLTARVCGVPNAVVNLFTEHELHQVAGHGAQPISCRAEDAMCWGVLDEPGTVTIPDARDDPRLAASPFVTGERGRARFYASHPLVTSDDVVVGRLCISDDDPAHADEQAEAALALLGTVAARVMEVLELRLRTRQLAESLARVEAMKAELQTSHDRLAAFAGQISHDLKSPLANVTLSLELIAQQVDHGAACDLGDVGWLTSRALGGATRMRALVDDVLAYAMVGGGQHARVDLAAVVAQVRDDLAGDLDDVALEVGVLPVVRGDHTQLRSLLQNLVANAAQQRLPERTLTVAVSAQRRGARWRVLVEDDGRGIDPADVDRVFEPLVRAADSPAGGHGIGLATCRRIVAAHGGTIGLEPRSGGGTTAWFELGT